MISNMAFTPVTGLRDGTFSPTGPINEASIRDQVQSISDQLRDYINSLLITLHSTTLGASGSEEIASPTITGITGNTIYTQLIALKTYIDSGFITVANGYTKAQVDAIATAFVLGTILDRSLINTKIALGTITQYELQDTLQNKFRWGAI